jgi:hypothetical protein
MKSWKSLVMVAVAMSFVMTALGIEVAADSHTKPQTEQTTEAAKKTTEPKTDAKSEKTGKGTATQQQSGTAGHEGHHADHEGSHGEEMDEGSH